MKIKSVGLLFACLLVFENTKILNAQNLIITNIPFTINAGYSFPNLVGNNLESMGTGSNAGGYNPVYLEFGYNYSQQGLVSLYLSDASARTGNFSWLDTASVPHHYSYVASVFTMGFSSRYYLKTGGKFLPYLGAMAGYYFINLTTNDELPASGGVTVSQGSFAYQIYLGMVYYFNNWLGLDVRAGYGNNYYAAIGLSFRFKVKDKHWQQTNLR